MNEHFIEPSLRQHIKAALAELERVLPNQAPLALVEHRNPLQGYLQMPFDKALAAEQRLTGQNVYFTETQFRALYAQGHIDDIDIITALNQEKLLQADEIALHAPQPITKAEVYRIAMLFEVEAVLPSQLAWQIEELNTLERFQPDIPNAVKAQLLVAAAGNEPQEKKLIAELWQLILNKLDLEATYLHPENMLDLSLDQAETLLAQHKAAQKKVSLKKASLHERMQEAVIKHFAEELNRLGVDYSLRNIMMDLCGVDILETVRPQMIRLCGAA